MCALLATSASAQVRVAALQDEAVAWFQSYIRVDTINPPGTKRPVCNSSRRSSMPKASPTTPRNRRLDGQHLGTARRRRSAGADAAASHRRGARQRGLVEHRSALGKIKDGYVYGRGALDTKSSGSCAWRRSLRSIARRRRSTAMSSSWPLPTKRREVSSVSAGS